MIINTIPMHDFDDSVHFFELSRVQAPIFIQEFINCKYYYFGDELELLKINRTLKLL